ncbi:cysteine hydrolase [Actinomycetota bacterium Odt1-20B]
MTTANSALLVMDVQRDIVSIADGSPGADPGLLPRLRRAIDAARAHRIPVIYVVIELRQDSRVSPRHQGLTSALRAGLFKAGEPGTAVHDAIAPQEGDTVVAKRRGSAFSGSDLDLVLRTHGVDSLVLAGIATSGVVLHTVCQANDLDLGLTVLEDGCLDLDPGTHRFLTEQLFPQWADVVSVDDWIKAL